VGGLGWVCVYMCVCVILGMITRGVGCAHRRRAEDLAVAHTYTKTHTHKYTDIDIESADC